MKDSLNHINSKLTVRLMDEAVHKMATSMSKEIDRQLIDLAITYDLIGKLESGMPLEEATGSFDLETLERLASKNKDLQRLLANPDG